MYFAPDKPRANVEHFKKFEERKTDYDKGPKMYKGKYDEYLRWLSLWERLETKYQAKLKDFDRKYIGPQRMVRDHSPKPKK